MSNTGSSNTIEDSDMAVGNVNLAPKQKCPIRLDYKYRTEEHLSKPQANIKCGDQKFRLRAFQLPFPFHMLKHSLTHSWLEDTKTCHWDVSTPAFFTTLLDGHLHYQENEH